MFKVIILVALCLGGVFGQSIGQLLGGECCDFDEIEVNGQGSVFGQPDMAIVRVRFESKQQTAQQVFDDINGRINALILVLNLNGYNSDDYHVDSISIYDDYNRGQVVGKRGSQTMTISIKNINASGSQVGTLIDQITTVDRILIDSVSFDIFDKSPLQEQARSRAFDSAKQKAKDYADAASLSVGRVITIIDGEFDAAPPTAFKAEALSIRSDAPTQVPIGEAEVSYRTRVVFALTI